MIKRTLYFGNPTYLHVVNQQLHVKTDERETTIPIEDIGIVVIDHPQVTISHALANALIENNAAVLWCDGKHLPSGLILPMTANHTYTEKLKAQLEASEPLKKQLWKQNVIAKIQNQASVLTMYNKKPEPLLHMASKVGSGDPENIEGQAANYYWKHLFEHFESFRRHRNGPPPNHFLNYGYAIVRAIVARALVSSGCLPALGIFHKNKYNPFCLADDMMEAYRPYVDICVMEMLEKYPEMDIPDTLHKEHKQHLLKIPVIDCEIEGEKSPLMVAAQRTTASLMKCFEGDSRKLILPQL